MPATSVLLIITVFAALAVAVLAALSRHKKAGSGDVKLIGEIATVETRLAPEGTVIVNGELWRARSNDGSFISSHARVRVVGFENILALVEPYD